jgi:hypothetical protein
MAKLTDLERRMYKYLWALGHPEEFKGYRKCWQLANPEKHKAACRKYKQKPLVKLRHSCRERVRRAVSGLLKMGHTKELLGCSYHFYKTFLERQFVPGMSWTNYGEWHIDHKIPICKFDLTTLAGQKAAFHYTNTQPLWARDNLIKGRDFYRRF